MNAQCRKGAFWSSIHLVLLLASALYADENTISTVTVGDFDGSATVADTSQVSTGWYFVRAVFKKTTLKKAEKMLGNVIRITDVDGNPVATTDMAAAGYAATGVGINGLILGFKDQGAFKKVFFALSATKSMKIK